ncbi:MAG: tetratricopeptide repeat protein [Xanthomonadales bacterium]|nr:tetratricopeptide repeat protein [Xanthomonadales bacterium]
MKSFRFSSLLLAGLVASPAVFAEIDPADVKFRENIYIRPYAEVRHNAELGDPQAQFSMGYVYYKAGQDPNVQGVSRDFRRAARWFRRAADQGHSGAQYNMGVLHLHGHGVAQDPVMAYAWLRQAERQGHANSAQLLTLLRGMLDEQQIEEGEKRAMELAVG